MSLKKALVALMVAAMVLGSVATVSAAGFSDVAGTKYASAAARLAALNILKGFEDGSFRPNDTVTRAQMAAIVVRSLNLESAASYAKVDTKFSDVPGSHWGAGYINVAVDQGILRGYPDGTFKPEAQVTYAEALAMLVRVLGYEPAVKGTWPTNYVVKAADIGISKNVNFTANAPAPRGDVALFTDQSLDKPLMIQSGFGTNTEYVVSGTNGTTKQTLISDKLDLDVLENVVVARTPAYALGSLAADEVQLGNNTYKIMGDQDVDGLMGYIVDAYVKEGKVFGMVPDEDLMSSDKIVKGLVSEETKVDNTSVNSPVTNAIVLQENDTKSYQFSRDSSNNLTASVWSAGGPKIENGTPVSTNTLASVLTTLEADDADANGTTGQASVTLFLDSNGHVRFMLTSQGNSGSKDLVVTSVDKDRQIVRGKAPGALDTESTIRLGDQDGYRIMKNGKVVGLSDIKEGDLVTEIQPMNGNNSSYTVLWVGDKKVTGKFEAITSSNSGFTSDAKLKIAGKDYELAANANVSDDGGKNHKSITGVTMSELTNLLDQDVVAYLNGRNEVRLITGTGSGANTFTAMIEEYINNVGSSSGLKSYVKVRKADGTEASYPFKDSDSFSTLTSGKNPGAIVEMSLDSNGNVKRFDARVPNDPTTDTDSSGNPITNTDRDASVNAASEIDSDADSIMLNGTRYYVVADTAIFHAYNGGGTSSLVDNSADIAETIKWSTLRKFTGTLTNVDYRVDGNILKELRVANNLPITSAADIGVITARGANADGETLTIAFNGTTKTYTIGSGATVTGNVYENGYDGTAVYTGAGGLATDDVITFDVDGDGDLSLVTEVVANGANATGEITKIDTAAKVVTIKRVDNTTVSYKIDGETQLFDTNGNRFIQFGDLGVGDEVQAFDTDVAPDGIAELVKILD